MDGIGNLSSYSQAKWENTEPHRVSDANPSLAVTEGPCKQELNISINTCGSIVETDQMVEGYDSTTIIATDGHETIKVDGEEAVNIKTEMIYDDGAETIQFVKPVDIKTEVLDDIGEGTIKIEAVSLTDGYEHSQETYEEPMRIKVEMIEGNFAEGMNVENPMGIKTEETDDNGEGTVKIEGDTGRDPEVTENLDIGIWKNDIWCESDRIPHMDYVDAAKLEMEPKVNTSADDPDLRNVKVLTNTAHTCRVCGKSLSRKCHLTLRELLHSADKPLFVCRLWEIVC